MNSVENRPQRSHDQDQPTAYPALQKGLRVPGKKGNGADSGQVREATFHAPVNPGGGAWIVVWLFQIVFVPRLRGRFLRQRRSKPIVNNRVERTKREACGGNPLAKRFDCCSAPAKPRGTYTTVATCSLRRPFCKHQQCHCPADSQQYCDGQQSTTKTAGPGHESVRCVYGPRKPPRLPNELIRAIPATAEVSLNSSVDVAQNGPSRE